MLRRTSPSWVIRRMLEVTKTNRGFQLIEFRDRYDAACSLQKSSLAHEDAIWFGCNENSFHSTTGEPLAPRMHLTQEQVRELLPYLQRFAETGELGLPKCKTCADSGTVTDPPSPGEGETYALKPCPDCQGGEG